jgi:pimeloyl-ACP methyl ester carboxylesterase
MKQRDLRKCVGNISVPVTYFYPVPGSLFSPELAGWYEEHVNTPFHAVQFEDCSHMMIEDQPEKFTEEVIKVLQK